MGRISFDAIGMGEILKRLDVTEQQLKSATGKALEAGAQPILEQAKANVHIVSGDLHKALKVGRRKSTRDSSSIEIGTFAGEAPHAHLVEFGHGGPHPAPPHPFLEPAYLTKIGEAEEIIAQTMREALP